MEQSYAITEKLLSRYAHTIGEDYRRYRNHVNRVFSFCVLLDGNEENIQKYAIAAVYHDIGIWTNKTIDYLEPSIAQLKGFLIESGKQEWIDEISFMIQWHHKITPYKGNYSRTVEIFRKADWIDVSLGTLRYGIPLHDIKELKTEFPNLGFHWFLARQITKNLLQHPLNPLPMFSR